MVFNIGNGLSTMGQSIANTAGAAALEMQKNDLETQRDQLAAQTAHGYKSQEMEQQGGIAAIAASKLADVNSAAADSQHKFETGIEQLRESGALARENISAGATVQSAQISAGASMANVKAQLSQADVQVGPDGTLMAIDKTTKKATPVLGDDGQPVKGVVPGQAALVRDAVNANNEQLRALTIRYDNELKGPQTVLDNLMKTNPDETDPDVIAARQAVIAVKKEYAPAFQHLNNNMDAVVASISSSALPGGGKAPTGNKPPLASFDKSAPAAPAPQAPGLINSNPAP